MSLIFLFMAVQVNERIDVPALTSSQFLLEAVFLLSLLLTLGLVIRSVQSLPASERGNTLSTRGAFKYVRHPLYAAFLWVFDFGLAFYLNSYVCILWAVIQLPVWHFVIRYEERLMVEIIGQAYIDYQRRTARFFPRLH